MMGTAFLLAAGLAWWGTAATLWAAEEAPLAAEKFIPTFAICYGNAQGARSTEETARFDMLICSCSRKQATLWGREGRNSWESLKALNPDMVLAIYALGPGEYNTASWGQTGDGWEWIKANHGKDSADPWIAVGAESGAYLQAAPYPNERLMVLGNPNWRRYWIENTYEDYWGGRKQVDLRGADALFADNVQFRIIWTGQWRVEGQPDRPDVPSAYYRDGQWLQDAWHADAKAFLEEGGSWFGQRGIKLIANFGYLGSNPGYWEELEALSHPPFAAMEEGGFVCPWGGDGKSFKFWDWEKKLAPFSKLRKVKALMVNHAGPFAGEGLAAMDSPDANGMTGWDALWFSLTSFLLGFDDVSRNGLMSFTIWGYSEYHWFDEFDPQYLHLGKALGPFEKRGAVHFREFEDGWVAVNGLAQAAKDVAVPRGKARVLNHANFKTWDQVPLVESFDLPAHRGVVLLKEGRQAGNADNL
jgi:hypothetical protein